MNNSASFIPSLLGENVQRFRKEQNLTQIELAEKIGITQKYLSEIESGIKFPSAPVIEQLVTVLQEPVSAFFGGSDINVYDLSNKVVDLLIKNIQPKLDYIYEHLNTIEKKINNMKFTIQTE